MELMARFLLSSHYDNTLLHDTKWELILGTIENLSLLSIPDTEKNALKRPEPLSESYTGNY